MAEAKWKQFSIEELEILVQNSTSFSELMRKMGYAEGTGRAQPAIKAKLEENKIDYSHFKGYAWNKKEVPLSSTNDFGIESKRIIRQILLKEREYRCESCGLTKWLEKAIPLEVHHKDGNVHNNTRCNLILLCPNCHALTDNWRGRNIKTKISDEKFLEALQTTSSICAACRKLGITPNENNYKRARRLLQNNEPF